MASSSTDGSVRVWVLRDKEQALHFQVKDQVWLHLSVTNLTLRLCLKMLSPLSQPLTRIISQTLTRLSVNFFVMLFVSF